MFSSAARYRACRDPKGVGRLGGNGNENGNGNGIQIMNEVHAQSDAGFLPARPNNPPCNLYTPRHKRAPWISLLELDAQIPMTRYMSPD